jgi:LacI family transcriptional regulator
MTLIDVAELAGVSKATVSRVMNDQGNVLADTVERVRAAAATVGYRKIPGGPGRRLKNQPPPAQVSTLNAHALVVPDVLGGLYLSLQEGLEAAANERYQQVIVCNSQNDPYKQ